MKMTLFLMINIVFVSLNASASQLDIKPGFWKVTFRSVIDKNEKKHLMAKPIISFHCIGKDDIQAFSLKVLEKTECSIPADYINKNKLIYSSNCEKDVTVAGEMDLRGDSYNGWYKTVDIHNHAKTYLIGARYLRGCIPNEKEQLHIVTKK